MWDLILLLFLCNRGLIEDGESELWQLQLLCLISPSALCCCSSLYSSDPEIFNDGRTALQCCKPKGVHDKSRSFSGSFLMKRYCLDKSVVCMGMVMSHPQGFIHRSESPHFDFTFINLMLFFSLHAPGSMEMHFFT